MPIHNWAAVDAGLFHHFHQAWTIEIAKELNGGALPPGYFALAEQVLSDPTPDVVTRQRRASPAESTPDSGAVSVLDAPPQVRFVASAEPDVYAARANKIVIRHRHGEIVAVIEILSPGSKSSKHALRAFVQKAADLLNSGIHLLVIDLFPPSARDPRGIHKAIWDEICEESFELPPDKPLTAAAYSAGWPRRAYVEPLAVGESLPDLPLFLEPERYVPAPLERAYMEAWATSPDALKEFVEQPGAPPE